MMIGWQQVKWYRIGCGLNEENKNTERSDIVGYTFYINKTKSIPNLTFVKFHMYALNTPTAYLWNWMKHFL